MSLSTTCSAVTSSPSVTLSTTAFFREYAGLPEETKEQLRQMAKILGGKKGT